MENSTVNTLPAGAKPFRDRLWPRAVAAALIILFTALVWVRCPDYFFKIAKDGTRTLYPTYTILCLLMAAVSVAAILDRRKTSRKAGWILSVIALIIWPVIDFLISEMAMSTGCDYLHLRRYVLILNFAAYYLMEAIVLALTLNIRIAVIAGMLLMFVFSAGNIYIVEFRQIPLYLTDLADIKTAGDVAGSYTLGLSKGIFLLLVFLVFTIILMHRIWPFGRKYIEKKRAIWRCVLIPVAVAGTVFSMWYIIRSPYPKKHGVSISTYRPIKSYRKHGGMLTFLRSGNYLFVDVPEGYSADVMAELEEAYPSDSASAVSTADVPNIIVIMDEAFSDLQNVGTFETNEDVMPFIHSMEENTIKGETYVSVFGGHTANSEYEFLTGNTCSFFAVGTPYVLYIKQDLPNITSYLQDLGTGTSLAMHPNTAANYNRQSVYSSLGFDDFLAIDSFTDAERVRTHVSDYADFQKIIEEYEASQASSDAPFFMFNVTMQNHSPYTLEETNLPKDITITSEGVADQEQAEQYLNLLHLTDQRVQELVEYFEQQDDPTMIVFFGDHEPGLSNAFYNSILDKKKNKMNNEEQMELYKTPFFIWANFPIEAEQNVKTSLNYLALQVKEAAGLPLTGYDKFLQQLKEKLPVLTANGTFDAEGNYYTTTSKDSPAAEEVKLYEYLVYNHLFKGSDRSTLFSLAE